MTATMDRVELTTLLRRMCAKLDAAVKSGEWTPETARILDLAEDIGEWMASRPHRWVLPAEPCCPVTDAEGRTWDRTGDPDTPWRFGRICTTWPLLLTRGPLTSAGVGRRRPARNAR